MKARVIDGKTYIDGGYSDNVPVKMAVEMGADDIVAVDLEAIGRGAEDGFSQGKAKISEEPVGFGDFFCCLTAM